MYRKRLPTLNLCLKHVKCEKSFFKIYGQSLDTTLHLTNLQKFFQNPLGFRNQIPSSNALYVVKIDNNFERCEIVINDGFEKISHVRLIDAGFREEAIPFCQLQPIDSSSEFSNPNTFCDEYYLAGFQLSEQVTESQKWEILKKIQEIIENDENAEVTIANENEDGKFAHLSINEKDLLYTPTFISFFKRGLIELVDLDTQIKMIADYAEYKKQMKAQQQQQHQQQMKPIARNLKPAAPPKFSRLKPQDGEEESLGTYKCNVVAHHTIHKIRITHYEKGVNLFYVHLQIMDANLQTMTANIQSCYLQNLKKRPSSLGMACLARHHKKIYRVAVAKSSEVQHHEALSYLCHFVDFGFSAHVKFDNLFYIPQEFITINAFAIPFCLSALKNAGFQGNMSEINCYFQQITENTLLTLKCVPLDGPPISQYCELFDNNVNILDTLKHFNPSLLKFPTQPKLDAKKTLNVKVCYAASVQEFYIHLEEANLLLQYDMQSYELERLMPKSPTIQQLKVSQICGVQIDSEWFRGIITGINKNVNVFLIDFGFIEEFPAKSIRLLTNKFTEMPPYAYRCCLKGFENEAVSENINTQFDIFCSDGKGERRTFKMAIDKFSNEKGYVVDLDDESVRPTANVNKILLKNSRPLAETITLENAKKRQKESQQKSPPEFTKEVKSPERSRNSSQRGRGNISPTKGSGRKSISTPDDLDGKRQRTHFNKQENKQSSGTYYQTPKEANLAVTPEKKPPKLKQSISSSSVETRTTPENTPEKKNPRKSKNVKSPSSSNSTPEKKQKEQQKLKREKSNVEKKKIKVGWVSLLNTINDAYVHFEEHVDGLEKLLNEIFDFYESQKDPQACEIQEGLKCALRSNDGNWYRGEIKKIKNETCCVFNMEYGNMEILHKSNLRILDEKFAKIERLISRAYFAIKPTQNIPESELLKEMQSYFNDGVVELNFEIVKKFKEGFILEVIDSVKKENLFDKLVKKNLAVRIEDDELGNLLQQRNQKVDDFEEISDALSSSMVSNTSTENIICTSEEERSIKSNDNVMMRKPRNIGKVTALTSPTDFYLVCCEDLMNFQQMHDDIQILAPAMPPLLDFSVGTLCLALQPFDSLWYRAKIIDSDESIITVVCVDNGKTFSIDNKISLKALPEQLIRKAFFGISCSLPISIERKCEENATEMMLKSVDLEIEFDIVLLTPSKTFVEIFLESENIANQLIEKSFAQRIEIFHCGPGFTSHINSLNDFYIQLEQDQLKLDLIGSIMDRAAGKFEKIENPEIGQMVAAKFSEDDCWYRAVIEEINGNIFEVKFIDYGNVSQTKEIGILDASITQLSKMSKRCRLSNPKNLLIFSDAAESKFKEICANGATVLNLKVIKPGEVTEVELFYQSENIIKQLTPLCDHHNDNNDDY